MICIWIIVLSFAITLCNSALTLSASLWSLGTNPLKLQSGLTQLDLSVCSSLHVIPLGKSVCRTRSGAAHKLKPGSSVEYFLLFFSYKYFLPARFRSTLEARNLTSGFNQYPGAEVTYRTKENTISIVHILFSSRNSSYRSNEIRHNTMISSGFPKAVE